MKKKLNKKKYKKDTVLFAPSWTYENSNLFNDYGLKIIKKLIDLKLNVILRPHPEIIKRFPDYQVLITCTTQTGSATIKKIYGNSVKHQYRPDRRSSLIQFATWQGRGILERFR